MRKFASYSAIAAFAAATLVGCTITRKVEPLPLGEVNPICFLENPEVWSAEFLPMLREELERHRIATIVYTGTRPPQCRFHGDYTANWGWDFAIYLVYANIRVFDESKLIGEVTYNAREGGLTFSKFGSTQAKIAPLIDQLVQNLGSPAAGGNPP